jgi:hypothetical protein
MGHIHARRGANHGPALVAHDIDARISLAAALNRVQTSAALAVAYGILVLDFHFSRAHSFSWFCSLSSFDKSVFLMWADGANRMIMDI